MQARLDARYLKLIRNWEESDCTAADTARHPRGEMAPNWAGPGTPCGSCSRCRPEQRVPSGDWDDWLYLAGRGAGKTRACAEYIAKAAALNHDWRIAIVAPTYADARDTCVEGESGLIAVFKRWHWVEDKDYTWNRSLGEVVVHLTNTKIKLFSAEKPNRLRGPQHHLVWVEELAQVVKDAPDSWDMMKFGLRLGIHPRTVCSTTPLPLKLIKDMLVDERVATSRGTTDDNRANLAKVALREFHKKYDGTRLGRQELGGELLLDIPGALWKREWLSALRLHLDYDPLEPFLPTFDEENALQNPDRFRLATEALEARGVTLVRIVIAIDPAVTSGEDADETGIIVVGKGDDDRLYVLDDLTCRETPDFVMERVVKAYDLYEANDVIVEVNNGGEYIPKSLRDTLRILGREPAEIRCSSIRAKKGKRVRAEPASALYGQGVVSHVGEFPHLEDCLCIWTPEEKDSPDRMDALVYAVLFLSDISTGSTITKPEGQQIQRHQQQRGQQMMATTSVRRSA